MKGSRIGIIIGREYMNRVKKKSFLVLTFLVPVLFAAMCVLPSLIMFGAKESAKTVAVVDASGIVMPFMTGAENITFREVTDMPVDSVKAHLSSLGYDAVLSISPLDSAAKTVSAEIYSASPLGMGLTESVTNRIDDAVEDYRVNSYGIEGLSEIVDSIRSDVRLMSFTLGEDGQEKVSAAGISMVISMVLGLMIFMFITLFGGMVMSAVIEEKSSRVVEVLISSVKATELMFGKIIGIALVALTQFLLWILLTAAIVGVVGAVAGSSLAGADPVEMVEMTGMDAEQTQGVLDTIMASPEMSALANVPFVQILVSFVFFFVFGYLLYASLFAAIGSAVENEGDSNQLQLPVTIPLMIGFFISFYANNDPDGAIVFWGSMIPFTSPIVMLARLPYGVPTWELLLSFALLVITFVVLAWFSAKVYRVGILMYGKKANWKDIFRWSRQK